MTQQPSTRNPFVNLIEVRCASCGRKLCYTNGIIEIKCGRCKYMQRFIPPEQKVSVAEIQETYKHTLSKRLGSSAASDFFPIDERSNQWLRLYWEAGNDIEIPSDLFFEKIIPLTDIAIALRKGSGGYAYTCRILVFDDVIKGIVVEDVRPGEVLEVGAMRMFLWDKAVSPSRITLTVPILIVKGNSSVVIPMRDIEAELISYHRDYATEDAIKRVSDAYVSFMKSWYGLQVALLNPVIKEVVTTNKRAYVDPCFRECSKKDYDEDAVRNSRPRYRYMRKIIINPEKAYSQSGSNEERAFTRRTRIWRVCGHWRERKGNIQFVSSYWKGPDKDMANRLIEERERDALLSEEAKITLSQKRGMCPAE